ncbi:MAG: hypothetical protein HQL97_12115 [Magnetococcales bacterium]|nr:hypothetical protein [Magnetococcales bacterium]
MENVKLIKARRVREILGGISTASLYRFWNIKKIIPAPKVILGMNYWVESEILAVVHSAGQRAVR